MKIAYFLLISLFLYSCASSEERDSKIQKADIYYSQGTTYLIDKDYTHALEYLLQAEKLNPKEPKILTNLGMAYFFKGQEEKAKELFEKALDIDPKYSDARNNLASLYIRQKKYVDAEREYKKVLEDLIYSNQFRTYYNLGYLFFLKNDFKLAKNYLQRSIKENENHCPAHFLLGEIYFRQHQYNEAYTKYVDATKGTCYNDPTPHFYQAVALKEIGEYDKALKKLTEITEKFRKVDLPFSIKKEMEQIQDLQASKSESAKEKRF